MKLRVAALLLLSVGVFSSCSKKQCPAYGQETVDQKTEQLPA